jgi:hypothetical protein
LTASYSLGGSGFPFSGSAVITGSFLVSQSLVDFSKSAGVTGSFTGSLFGTASYAYTASSAISSSFATFAYSASFAPGFSVSMSQVTPALTWSFTHNLNSRNPVVQVYDTTYAQIIPNQVVGMDNSTAEIRFDYAQAGYAVFSNGGGLYVTGSTSTLVQTVGAATWSFTHNLNNKYNTYEVYDNNDYVLIPSAIKAVDNNSAELYFSGLQTGRAIAQFSGINGAPNATTASYALTASFILPLSQSVAITGSGTTNSTLAITGIQANSAVNPPKGTISLYYDGVDGATAGVYGASVIFSQRYNAPDAAPIAIGMIAGVKVNSGGNFGGGLTFWTSDETLNNLAERARIDVSGRMAIGHKSPTALLHVSGSGSGSLFQISSHSSTNIFYVSGSGNVGVGKANPAAKLDISGSMLVTGSLAMSGSFTQVGYKILTTVSQSLNYSDDTAAAAGGVPLGGLYRNGNFILIRLS